MSKRGGGGRGNGDSSGTTTPAGAAAHAGTALPAPDDRILFFADSLQHEREKADERVHEWENWVTCRVGDEVYALPITQVQEILRVGTLTRVPHAPFPVRGVTNLRGYVLPVVDLRVRLGLQPAETTGRHRIMVLHSRGRLIGLLVEAVDQVEKIDRLAVDPPPEDVMTEQSYYLIGVYHMSEEKMVILLDADRVLQVRDRDAGGR